MQAMLWCAFNGVGLALVIPCVSSLIADYNTPEKRGSAFGLMSLISATGEAGSNFSQSWQMTIACDGQTVKPTQVLHGCPSGAYFAVLNACRGPRKPCIASDSMKAAYGQSEMAPS